MVEIATQKPKLAELVAAINDPFAMRSFETKLLAIPNIDIMLDAVVQEGGDAAEFANSNFYQMLDPLVRPKDNELYRVYSEMMAKGWVKSKYRFNVKLATSPAVACHFFRDAGYQSAQSLAHSTFGMTTDGQTPLGLNQAPLLSHLGMFDEEVVRHARGVLGYKDYNSAVSSLSVSSEFILSVSKRIADRKQAYLWILVSSGRPELFEGNPDVDINEAVDIVKAYKLNFATVVLSLQAGLSKDFIVATNQN